jgi:hypothetical protein
MARMETTWDLYRPFMKNGKARNKDGTLNRDTDMTTSEAPEVKDGETLVDTVTQPTPPYIPMHFSNASWLGVPFDNLRYRIEIRVQRLLPGDFLSGVGGHATHDRGEGRFRLLVGVVDRPVRIGVFDIMVVEDFAPFLADPLAAPADAVGLGRVRAHEPFSDAEVMNVLLADHAGLGLFKGL